MLLGVTTYAVKQKRQKAEMRTETIDVKIERESTHLDLLNNCILGSLVEH